MKNLIIIFFIILPNLTFADLLDKFSLACICDKSINALKYFDCKHKVSGTQLDLLKEENIKDKYGCSYKDIPDDQYEEVILFLENLRKNPN